MEVLLEFRRLLMLNREDEGDGEEGGSEGIALLGVRFDEENAIAPS